MKALISYLAVAALIVASSFTVSQQKQLNQSANSCFNKVKVHGSGKANVAIAWSVSSADITQFIVERSYDGEFYKNVTTVKFNGSSSYTSRDLEVFPGTICYRVTAVKTDGTREISPIEIVRITKHG